MNLNKQEKERVHCIFWISPNKVTLINWDNPGYPWLVPCGPERGPEEVLRRWVWNVPSSAKKTCV